MRAKSDLGTKVGYAVYALAVTGTFFWVGEAVLDSLGESGAVDTFTEASFTTRVDAPLFARDGDSFVTTDSWRPGAFRPSRGTGSVCL